MIDDKKIEAAAEEYNEKVENELEKKHIPKRTFAERYAESAIRECAFKTGAKWAICEFLKDLWYPASEKPADNEYILVESTFGSTSYELSLGMYYYIDECDEYHGDSWEVQAAKQRVTRWLYVNDILPKEGGEQ